jgi:hypothetical protein
MNAHSPKNTHRSDLRPLPMRITKLQFQRLQSVRARDGLAIQEHVRRALDIYLAGVDAQAEEESPPPASGGREAAPVSSSSRGGGVAASGPKIVSR